MHPFSATLLIVAVQLSDSFSLTRHYRRPICEESQSCSYTFKSFDFELCDCPGNKQCPSDPSYGVEMRGITYQFCTRRAHSECEAGEVAAEVFTLQTSIFCICPPHMVYNKRITDNGDNVQYVCEEKPMCMEEAICGTLDRAGLIRPHCMCPEGWSCAVGESNDLEDDMEKQVAICKPI